MKKQYKLISIFFFSFLILSYYLYNPSALYFLNDDLVHIPLSSNNFFFQHHSFRVMHEILVTIEYNFFGKNAAGYHYVQYFIHLVCSVLVYFFSQTICKEYGNLKEQENSLVSILTASFFCIYAFHSESVLWILGTTASLATLFFLASTIAYMKRDKGVFFVYSLLFFQLGLFTYESNWVAPVFIGLLSWATIQKSKKEWKKESVYPFVYIGSFLINLVIRKIIIGQYGGSYGDQKLFGFDVKRIIYNGVCLLVRSFIPPSQSSVYFIAFTVLLFIILAFYVRKIIAKKKGDMLMLILALSFLASLIPVLTLGISTHSRESERYLYLPSIFLCLFIIYSLFKLYAGNRLCIAVIFLFAYNIFFLYINARDYAVAGNIAKSYYTHLEKEKKDTGKIVLVKFPQQFNGLPLFRLGFKEGLFWIDNIDTNRIEIPKDEELKVSVSYTKAIATRDFSFNFKESKTDSNQTIELMYDSTYFSIADFNKQ